MASSGWTMFGSSQVYMERMKSVLLTLWVSSPGGVSTLNGSSVGIIDVRGRDDDRQIGPVGVSG